MTFNLFESFFLMSLGITFSLILIIFYHFKERIRFIENKTDNLFSLIQDLAEELKKPQYEKLNSGSPYNMLNISEEHPLHNETIGANQLIIGTDLKNFESNLDIELESNEELSYFDDSEEDIDEDEDQDDEDEDEDQDDEDEDEDEVKNKINCDKEREPWDEEENFEKITIPDIKVIKQEDTKPEENKTKNINFKKMHVGELRDMIIAKGLCDDPSKMKKVDLIELLQSKM